MEWDLTAVREVVIGLIGAGVLIVLTEVWFRIGKRVVRQIAGR